MNSKTAKLEAILNTKINKILGEIEQISHMLPGYKKDDLLDIAQGKILILRQVLEELRNE